MFVIIFVLLLKIIFVDSIGYSDNIIIGTNQYHIGINIDINDYPVGTAYNIQFPNDPDNVALVIQQALDDIALIGGGIININSGLYVSRTNLFIKSNNTKITGQGIDKTIIKLADYAPSFIIGTKKASGFLRAKLLTNIIVSNLTLDGNKYHQFNDYAYAYGRYGIFTEACDNIWFDAVKIIDFQGYGFDPHGWKKYEIWGNYLTVTNCIAANNEYDGFTLDQTLHMFVSNCSSYDNGRHGFNIVTGSKFMILVNNTATNNGFYDPFGGSGCAFMIQNNQLLGTSDALFSGNHAVNNKKAGVCMNDVSNITFSNNHINGAHDCYYLNSVVSSIIADNECAARRQIKAVETNIFWEAGIYPDVYVYNNSFVAVAAPNNPNTSIQQDCVYGHMKCVNDYGYRTCNIDSVGNTFWNVIQFCADGLFCHQTGDYIYCY